MKRYENILSGLSRNAKCFNFAAAQIAPTECDKSFCTAKYAETLGWAVAKKHL